LKRGYMDYIEDMATAIAEMESFTQGMDRMSFDKDRKTVNAVLRSLEVLGEAARGIPETIKEKYSEIPWFGIIGMRNKLIHEYFGVDLDMVWETIVSEYAFSGNEESLPVNLRVEPPAHTALPGAYAVL
jgi:uncharacterized protein with HEPN domain